MEVFSSTPKKAVLNKEYYTLTSKQNVLFNSKEAVRVGYSTLEQAFEDSFCDLIAVESTHLNIKKKMTLELCLDIICREKGSKSYPKAFN